MEKIVVCSCDRTKHVPKYTVYVWEIQGIISNIEGSDLMALYTVL
jgi:hypothetical protein